MHSFYILSSNLKCQKGRLKLQLALTMIGLEVLWTCGCHGNKECTYRDIVIYDKAINRHTLGNDE